MVTVKFSSAMKYAQLNGTEITVAWTGGTVAELLKQLQVDLREVGTVLLNDQAVKLNCPVETGSHLYLLPMLCGG